ncbi:DNA-binding protein [Haladaptatus sp. W1]|uniref:helix-turn-helix domain-containing protein n=1 Tax=Haladaptatus sp. W1 TaxID=1897478 RepID=UPI000849C4D1|nr:helix-turn-helix domain-containing protein [Haladaptatus sp. W1]ODR80397.1 DNA-binding protein [Haladaptatus sp. W1]
MIEYTFRIEHNECWTERINDVFPNIRASIIYSYLIHGTSITMIEVTQVEESEIDELVDWLQNHPVMNTSRLVSYTSANNRGVICLEGNYDVDTEPVLNVLLRNNCFPTIPATVVHGHEHWDVLSPSHEQVSQAHEELQQLGSVKIDSLHSTDFERMFTGLLEVKKAIQDLSARQLEVLSLAIEEGYYDSPRSCKLEDLAELDPTGVSTVGEHLRLSESKILKAIEPMLDRQTDDD